MMPWDGGPVDGACYDLNYDPQSGMYRLDPGAEFTNIGGVYHKMTGVPVPPPYDYSHYVAEQHNYNNIDNNDVSYAESTSSYEPQCSDYICGDLDFLDHSQFVNYPLEGQYPYNEESFLADPNGNDQYPDMPGDFCNPNPCTLLTLESRQAPGFYPEYQPPPEMFHHRQHAPQPYRLTPFSTKSTSRDTPSVPRGQGRKKSVKGPKRYKSKSVQAPLRITSDILSKINHTPEFVGFCGTLKVNPFFSECVGRVTASKDASGNCFFSCANCDTRRRYIPDK